MADTKSNQIETNQSFIGLRIVTTNGKWIETEWKKAQGRIHHGALPLPTGYNIKPSTNDNKFQKYSSITLLNKQSNEISGIIKEWDDEGGRYTAIFNTAHGPTKYEMQINKYEHVHLKGIWATATITREIKLNNILTAPYKAHLDQKSINSSLNELQKTSLHYTPHKRQSPAYSIKLLTFDLD